EVQRDQGPHSAHLFQEFSFRILSPGDLLDLRVALFDALRQRCRIGRNNCGSTRTSRSAGRVAGERGARVLSALRTRITALPFGLFALLLFFFMPVSFVAPR